MLGLSNLNRDTFIPEPLPDENCSLGLFPKNRSSLLNKASDPSICCLLEEPDYFFFLVKYLSIPVIA